MFRFHSGSILVQDLYFSKFMQMLYVFCVCVDFYFPINLSELSHVVRKPAFCICENKDADQLRGNREADQRLCFSYTDSTIPLLPIYEISSH